MMPEQSRVADVSGRAPTGGHTPLRLGKTRGQATPLAPPVAVTNNRPRSPGPGQGQGRAAARPVTSVGWGDTRCPHLLLVPPASVGGNFKLDS